MMADKPEKTTTETVGMKQIAMPGTNRVLLCHAGFHRAASSSIQVFLEENRDKLTDLGWSVILRKDLKETPALLGIRRGHWRDRYLPTWFARLFRVVRHLKGRSPSILVSEENLLGHMPSVKDDFIYPRAGATILFLKMIAWLTNRRLIILLVTRDEDDWRRSIWAFRKLRDETRDSESFSKALTGSLQKTTSLVRRKLGKDLYELPLSDLTANTLRTLLGLEVCDDEQLARRNTAQPDHVLEQLHRLQTAGIDVHDKRIRDTLLPRLRKTDQPLSIEEAIKLVDDA